MSDETKSWNSVVEHLSMLVKSVGEISPDLHRRVPNDELWQFKALTDTGEDIFMTTILTLEAIDQRGKLPPKIAEVWPEAGHDAEDRLRIWAADPVGYKRPQWTIVAMAASAWCNALEGFLRGVATTAVDAKAIGRVRAAFPDANIEWNGGSTARERITARMLPSTKRKGQSFQYLEAVFGSQIDSEIKHSLRSLIAFRNEVTHPKKGRTHEDHRHPPSSIEWMAWALSVRCLAGTLVRALADRLDERRAVGEHVPLFPGK